MVKYTCYETGQTLTKTEWYVHYLVSPEIDKTEYPDFLTWWEDMRKSGVLEEE